MPSMKGWRQRFTSRELFLRKARRLESSTLCFVWERLNPQLGVWQRVMTDSQVDEENLNRNCHST